MNHAGHRGLKTDPRPTDYIKGISSPIPFREINPSGDWTPRIAFYEAQKFTWDTDGCVLFAAQESFDAQMDLLIPTLPTDVAKQIFDMGFMDTGLDGNVHFHSSPRFLEIMTGNGTDGNNLCDAWDAIRKYGVLPWKDLPFDATISQQQYFARPSKLLLDKAAKFLALIGGKQAVQYHWVINGSPKNLAVMQKALMQAPLCLGIAVGPYWNQVTPTDPPDTEPPAHSVMDYKHEEQDVLVYDHYEPAKKVLDPTYSIRYVLQGIVSPIFAPTPTPPALPTNVAPTQSNVNILTQIVALYQRILALIKGRSLQSNTMNYSLFRSRTFWTLLVGFLINVYQLAAPTLPPAAVGVLDTVVLILSSYFHLQTGNSTAGSN